MATRKQRRRREKTFRHEYGFVVDDEEGNEVEVEGAELRAKKDPAVKAKSSSGGKGSSSGKSGGKSTGGRRVVRDPEPPTWNRAARRGLLWGAVTIALSIVLLKGVSVPIRVAIGVVYAALFVPITYWMDGIVYKRFLKRSESGGARAGKRR
jgi:hypothetical protein